jgi:hypothetical protein
MSYGLKEKLPAMVESMQALRKGTKTKAGREVSLRQHIARNFKTPSGEPLSVQHLYAEMGIDEDFTSISELMEMESGPYLAAEVLRESLRRAMGLAQREQIAELRARALASFEPITGEQAGGQRWVSPEVFLDPVNRGAVQGSFYNDLIIRNIPVAQPQVIMPKIDLSDAVLADSNEAATAEEGSVTYGSKTVTIAKKARAIKITDEAVLFSPISMLSIFFEDFGRVMAHTLNGMAVDTIVNGDQADLSEAATVIGVLNTTNGITWADYVQVAIRFGLIGQVGTQIIANEATGNTFLNLAEVKNRYQGTPLMAVDVKTPFSMPNELFVSPKIGANKVAINDRSSSLIQLTARPLLIETDRIVMKQINGTVASIYTGFAKVQRKASVIIDGSILFSGNGFPTYMAPFAG